MKKIKKLTFSEMSKKQLDEKQDHKRWGLLP